MSKLLGHILLECLVGYLLFLVVIVIFQRCFLYFPFDNARPDLTRSPDMDVIKVETADGLALQGWYKEPAEKDKPVILFFHGNAGSIEVRPAKIMPFLENKYGVLLAEYRGYGGNPGKPSEQGLYQDGRAYLDWLIEEQKIKPENIVLYGESLGSGIAVQMGTEYNIKGLILEVPFSSALDVARLKFFIIPFKNILMWDQYLSDEKIAKITKPVLIGVAGKDIVIPSQFGRKLYEAANEPKLIFEYPLATHMDIHHHGFARDMIDFVKALIPLENPKQESKDTEKQSLEKPSREAKRRSFESFDKTKLSFLHWPKSQLTKGTVVLIHRGHEHAERIAHITQEADLKDYNIYALDMRGHGHSKGAGTDGLRMDHLVRDLDEFIKYIVKEDDLKIQNIAVIGQSVGAVVAATWVHDYSPKIRSLVLAAPAFEINLYVPLAETMIRWAQKIIPELKISSYVSGRMLTQDEDRASSYHTDPRITRDISARLLIDLRDTANRLVNDASSIKVPTQVLMAGDDYVVDQGPIKTFYEKLGADNKKLHLYEGLRHDILGERDRMPVLSDMMAFIDKTFEPHN